ncbi:radical SAM protein [Candidatus Woesearchaeota archaeon]|nr:radical SAM protein [Candidatus Woesearchaeota archaeon]
MRFLFTLPRFEKDTNPPQGISYIAAVLRNAGHHVEILDPTFKGFGYAKKGLIEKDYDVLGISTYTKNHEAGLLMAKIAKEHHPSCIVVFGGVHPTILSEETIKDDLVDIVVIGEGEETLLELAERLEKKKELKGVKGILYKKNKKVFRNPPRPLIENLDALPFPARDLLPMHEYLNAKLGRAAWAVRQPATSMVSSRGCPFRCTYCSSHLIFGRRVRFRSPQNIIDEIKFLKKEYGLKGLTFVDDTFTLNKKLVTEFCGLLLKEKIKVDWVCNGRVDTVSKEMLRLMKKAGCKVIAFGVESGNQRILDDILHKDITLERVERAFRWCREVGIKTDAYFMLGIPGETLADMKQSIRFAKKIKADVANFAVTNPLPKTELYDIAKKYGKITARRYSDFDYMKRSVFVSDTLNPRLIEKMQRQANRRFYLNIGYVWRQLFSIRSLSDLRNKFNGFLMVLKRQ